MPFHYDIREDPSHVHVRVKGRINAEQGLTYFRKCIEERMFYPSIPILYDLDEGIRMDIGKVNDEKVDAMTAMVQEARGEARYRVAVVGGAPDVRTFLLMAQEMAGGAAEGQAFDDVAEAIGWLCPAADSPPEQAPADRPSQRSPDKPI